jgi:hypothetical protein
LPRPRAGALSPFTERQYARLLMVRGRAGDELLADAMAQHAAEWRPSNSKSGGYAYPEDAAPPLD